MYPSALGTAGATTGALASTGMVHGAWLVVAGITLAALGCAIIRLVPRAHTRNRHG